MHGMQITDAAMLKMLILSLKPKEHEIRTTVSKGWCFPKSVMKISQIEMFSID